MRLSLVFVAVLAAIAVSMEAVSAAADQTKAVEIVDRGQGTRSLRGQEATRDTADDEERGLELNVFLLLNSSNMRRRQFAEWFRSGKSTADVYSILRLEDLARTTKWGKLTKTRRYRLYRKYRTYFDNQGF